MRVKNMTKNYGFIYEEKKPEDYIFGASSVPMKILQENMDWTYSLPIKEYQNLNNMESYACVTFTILNCVEILIKKQYGEERNYSERFLATMTGTKELKGNTPKAVAQFLRKLGVVKQGLLPFSKDIDSSDKFYSPISEELQKIAKDFVEEFEFSYEYVDDNPEAIKRALQCSPLGVAVVAWYNRNGKYYSPKGMRDTHFTTLFSLEDKNYKRVFDSYDNAIKDLEWDMPHSVITRYHITKRKKKPLTYCQKVKRYFGL